MALKRFCFLSACTVLAVPLIMGGCPEPTTVVPGDCIETGQCLPGQSLPDAPRPLTAAVSSSRPIVIRGDVAEGTAVISVISSVDAQFEWSVEVPSRFTSAEDFLAFCAGPADACNPLSDGLNTGTEDFLRITEILDDPGAQGSRVTIRVTVTALDENGDPTGDPIEQSVAITIERRVAELALSLTHPARIAPSGTVTISALISGGSPFIYQGGDAEANQCPGSSFTSVGESDTLRTLPPLTADGAPEATLSADNQVPFCISALVRETDLDADDDGIAFELVDGSALFEITNDGNTRVSFSYTAPEAQGSVAIDFVVTDERGNQITQTALIDVASADQLLISQALAGVSTPAPGDSVSIDVAATGGEPPYTIALALIADPIIGSLESSGCSARASGQVCRVNYLAPPDEVGAVQIRARATDSVGATAERVIPLTVAPPESLRIAIEAERDGIQPNDTTGIETQVFGGTPPYDVCYLVTNGTLTNAPNESGCDSISISNAQGGTETLSQCLCNVGDPTTRGLESLLDSRQFRAPSANVDASVRVAVRDAVGITIRNAVALINVAPDESGNTSSVSASPISKDAVTSQIKKKVCVGSPDGLTIEANPSGGVPPYSFSWSLVGPGTLSPGGNADPQTFIPDATLTGITVITVNVSDSVGGGGSGVINDIETLSDPIARAGVDGADADSDPDPLEVCENDSAGLTLGGSVSSPTASGGSGIYAYEWTLTGLGSLDQPTASNPVFDPSGAGGTTTTACVKVTDDEGCPVAPVASCVEITIHPFPLAAAVSDAADICSGETIQLTATPGLTCHWTGPGIVDPDLCVATAVPPANLDPSITVGHTYSVEITDANGCTGSDDTDLVIVHGLPDATITAADTCKDATGVQASVPALAGATYLWSDVSGTAVNFPVAPFTNEITFDVASDAVELSVVVTSVDGCVTTSATTTVAVDPISTIAVIATNSDAPDPASPDSLNPAVCIGSTANTASVTPPIPGAISYLWEITGPGTITSDATTNAITYEPTTTAGENLIHLKVTIERPNCTTVGEIDVDVFDPAGVGLFGCDDGIECTQNVCNKGVCSNPNVTAGTLCNGGLDTGACDNPDTCDGAGVCQPNPLPLGSACGDAGTECTNQDTCDGAGSCIDNGFVASGTSCGDPAGVCSLQDTCDGLGTCQVNDEPAGTFCGDAGTECVNQDTCDGSGICVDNGFVSAGTNCGDGPTDCSLQDTCDGAGACAVNHVGDGTICTDDGNECLQDFCTNGACIHPPFGAGQICGNPANTACTDPDTCDGAGACQDNHINEGGTCDVSPCTTGETCTGGTCGGGAAVDCSGVGADACNDPNTCDPLGLEGNCDIDGATINDGGACDDGLACNAGETCTGGTCGGGAAVDCSGVGADACNDPNTCDPLGLEGNCDIDGATINEGGTCNDGDAATCDDVCGAGTCAGHVADTEGPLGDPTCSDGIDNDCDGDIDGADVDCQ